MARAYSMDLRARVLRDAGLSSKELAARYHVSRAWVDALKQRRRETGDPAPRKQTRWRTPMLAGHEDRLRALELPRALRELDLFDVVILDDIGYVQQSPEDAEVLFTLIAERYERRSLAVTSNLVFSQWDRIFKDQMATAAAIDRLVHHAAILEFDVASYRTDQARRDSQTVAPPRAKGRPPVSVLKRKRMR